MARGLFLAAAAVALGGIAWHSYQSGAAVAPSSTNGPKEGGVVVWKAGDPALGRWTTANTNQCGQPVQNRSQFSFNLRQNGQSCGRNQMLPLDAGGDLVRLVDGRTYTWTFHYIDGTPSGAAPGMGLDSGSNPDSSIWQIHGYTQRDSPCTGLPFVNGAYYPGQTAGQEWSFTTCNGNVWFGKYTPQEQDDWKIVATISATSSGETKLYRNGVLMVDDHGANYRDWSGNPWFNFGPYKWRWQLPDGGGSAMTEVNATINDMTLTETR
jgi:hypothetical protein